MAAEARIIFRAESRQAQGEIQTLRGKLAQLNQVLAEQRNRLIGATAEERKNIQAHIAANTALKATIRSRIEQTNLQKQAITQTQRETRERERAAQQQVRASQQISAAQRAVVQELAVGARVIYQQLSQVTGGFVRAAADMETFRNVIHVVTQDAGETNRILGDLLKLTVDLVGIDTSDLISYAGRLMAVGLSAEQAQTVISGVTKRIAEQGRSSAETRQSLEQVVQSFNTGRAVMFDFRTLMRLMPKLWDDISNALGENVRSTEDFNRVAQTAGGHTQALVKALTEMDRASRGANLSTLRSQGEILLDLSSVLASELGKHLIPAIVAVLKQVNAWIESFINAGDGVQKAVAWAAALATTLTGLVTVIGTATLGFGALSASLSALTGASGVAALTAGVGGLVAALAAAAPYIAVGGIIIGGIALLAKAIDDTSESARVLSTEITRLDKVTQVYNLTTGQLEKLTTAQANSYANFQERVKGTQDEIQSLSTRLQENREEQEKLNEALNNVSSPEAFLVLEKDLENVIAKEQELVAALDEATNKLSGLKFEIPTENLTELIESLEEQIVRAVDEVLRLRDAFGEVSRSDEIQEIQTAASNLTAALKRELDLQLEDTKLTTAERLDLELTHAREVEGINREVQKRITKINEENAKKQAEAVERQTDARIESAERARAAEVAGHKLAAQSGQEYAEQLRQIGSVSQREAFVDLVNRLQEQGLSFDEARAEASRYLGVLVTVSRPIEDADIAYRNFSSTLVSESERSADAVANLLSGVQALGSYLGDRLPDVAGSLERSALNEQRYFQQNPIGLTIEEDQQRAGQQGRDYVNRLFGRQDQEAERTEREAARETAQELREMASAIDSVIGELSTFENDIGSLTTKIGQVDIAGLASGNPLSIATLPFQLYDAFTFDQRQAEARLPELDRQNREAFERGEFGIPTDLLEFGRGQLARATSITEDSQLRALLGGLDPQIGKTTLDEVATIPDRIIETTQSYTDSVLAGLREKLEQVQFNLDFAKQSGGDVQGALQSVIDANTALYQQQIDSYNLQRLATGRAIGNIEGLNRTLNALNNESRLALEALPSSQRFNLRSTIADRQARGVIDLASGRENTENIARAQYGTEAYDAEVAAATPAESIAPVIESVNEGIEIINAAILSIETRIEQSNDPEEIARLLSQVPDLIRQKYEMLRKALEARFGAGEITESVFNASLSELQSNEAREIERHSDTVLSNTLRMIDEDAQLINASITTLQTQIDSSNDPSEIATLLDQIPALITEKYRLLRKALDEKYVAGEISVDVYNASLKAINNSQASETERHSDTVLANTLSEIDDNVALIDASIESLQFSISQSDDPQAIAGFLEAIRILIADKYRRLRERLDELLAAEEISQTAFDAATLGLTTAENRALAGLDTQALNAISAEAQEQVAFINGSIENLRLSLQLTDNPAEIQQILDAIKVLTAARFTVLREELEALRETLKPEQYQQALKGLNLAETLALENLNTEKFDAISAEAEKQVTAINTDIENLRLSLQLTDDPTERQQILDAIRILTVARFSVLREELENIKDSLDPEDYNRAVKGVDLAEAVALKNLDTEKFSEISAAAQKQVDIINTDIENLRKSFELADDPEVREGILIAIRALIVNRFKILREELIAIRGSFDSDADFQRALRGLNLGEQLSLKNLDSEKFDLISEAAQKQVSLVDGHLSNLELSLQLTDDPTEIQAILAAIRILIAKRFEILIEELKKIKDSFDSDEEFGIALTGLELGRDVALRDNTRRTAEVAVGRIGTALGEADSVIAGLFDDLAEQTTPEGVREAIGRLRSAIQAKYFAMREKINASAESEEEKARQIAGVNAQETQALEGLGERGLGQLNNLVDTAQFLLDNASEAEFGTRRQDLIDAIDNFYDARIAFINGLDLSDTDRANMLEVVRIQRKIALDAIPQMHESVTERLEMEKELQDDIKDLRDQETENEQNRLEAIADLNERHKDRLLDIEQDYQDKLKKIREEEREAGEDILTDQAHSLEDLRNKVARDLFSDAVNFDDLTEEQKQQVRESLDFRRGADDINRQSQRAASEFRQEFGVYRPGTQFGDTGIAQVLELLESGEITREQAIPFIGSRRVESFEEQQRATQEAETRRTEREADINAQAEATATAIQTALEPLITQNQTTADKEATTAQTESETATTAATTATTEATTADTNATTAISQVSIAELERTNAETFKTGLTVLSQMIPKLQDFSSLPNTFRDLLSKELIEARIQRMVIHSPREVTFDYLEIQAGVVNVRGGVVNFPDTRSARTANRNQNSDRFQFEASPPTEIVVQIDKKEVGRAVSEEITRTEQRGDNI